MRAQRQRQDRFDSADGRQLLRERGCFAFHGQTVLVDSLQRRRHNVGSERDREGRGRDNLPLRDVDDGYRRTYVSPS